MGQMVPGAASWTPILRMEQDAGRKRTASTQMMVSIGIHSLISYGLGTRRFPDCPQGAGISSVATTGCGGQGSLFRERVGCSLSSANSNAPSAEGAGEE